MSIEDIMAKERWATEEAYIRGNADAFDEVFAPDCLFHHPPSPDFRGLDKFKGVVPTFTSAFPFSRIDWEEVICAGNTAVQRYTFHMKHTGTSPDIPVPPTGKEVAYKGCAVYHLENGKIVEFFNYADTLGFLQQLGVVPPMGQK